MEPMDISKLASSVLQQQRSTPGLVADAIRLAIGRGHVDFVETLAESVAEIVLRHARVTSVVVRVEKLDVIAGAVGVEIRRQRARNSRGSHVASQGTGAPTLGRDRTTG